MQIKISADCIEQFSYFDSRLGFSFCLLWVSCRERLIPTDSSICPRQLSFHCSDGSLESSLLCFPWALCDGCYGSRFQQLFCLFFCIFGLQRSFRSNRPLWLWLGCFQCLERLSLKNCHHQYKIS